MSKYRLDAQWADDCCGKKDYDGDIISISTRYWPRGGGHGFMFDTNHPERGCQDIKNDEPPSACSSLILLIKGYPDFITLAEKRFVADTPEEVQAQVERWAQKQMNRLIWILRLFYRFRKG
jgi:hypothetical protein